jgi:hypothetical protein
MNEQEAARAAALLAARALSSLGEEDVARFLGLSVWEGNVRNADVVAVEKALTSLAIELHQRCLGGSREP